MCVRNAEGKRCVVLMNAALSMDTVDCLFVAQHSCVNVAGSSSLVLIGKVILATDAVHRGKHRMHCSCLDSPADSIVVSQGHVATVVKTNVSDVRHVCLWC